MDNLSQEERERFSKLSDNDQLKLKAIFDMLAKEKGMKNEEDKKELPDSIKKAEQDQIEKDARKSRGDIKERRKDLYKGGLSDRIEGLLNQPMKKKFLDMGMDLIQDLLEEDPFDIDDVVNHLAAELGKYYDDFLGAGERLNSIEIDENGDKKDYSDEIAESDIDAPLVKQTVAKANNQIRNAADMADFVMDVIDNIMKKEQEGIINNAQMKIAIGALEKLRGEKDLDMKENHAMQGVEAELESGEIGNMDAFTEEFIGESTQEESVAKYIKDYYRNPKTGESMISDDIVMEYYRTHKDWDLEGRWDGSKEGMEDGMRDFQEFFDANYSYMFDDAKIDEDKALKEHFKRFMFKNYQ